MNPLKMRALVVDDEHLARAGLRRLLAKYDDIEVIGDAGNGRAALAAIREQRPDLVFLDVQMPAMTGIEVMSSIPPAERPVIIFVTAYDQYAIKAFELHAVDYLAKPYRDQRLDEAVARARSLLRSRDHGALAQKLDQIADYFQRARPDPHPEVAGRLVVKVDGELLFIEPVDVVWIEGQADYVRIHRSGPPVFVRETLTRMEARLDVRQFQRVHKSAIVNLGHIMRVKSLPYGDHALELRDGAMVRIGRSYRDKVNALVRPT